MSENQFNLGKVIDDAMLVITQPREFYRNMRKTGGFAEPCIYLLVMAALGGVLATVLSMLGLNQVGSMSIGLVSIIVFPIMALIGSFIGALIMFVIWKLMGSEHNYEVAYRSIAYTGAIYPAVMLFSLVPYLGTIAGVCWGMYLMYIATVQVHGVAEKTAQLGIGIITFLLLMIQLSAEHTSRNLQATMESLGHDMESSAEELGKAIEAIADKDMTSEEAGRAMGEFFKGLSEALPEDIKNK